MKDPSRGIRGILFDLDGVLVFTDRLHFAAWKALADRLGVDFQEEDNLALRGVSRAESLERLLQKAPGLSLRDDEKQALAEEKNKLYRASLVSLTPAEVLPQTRKTLAELRRRGYRLAVASSSQNAAEILARVGLTDAFDAIVTGCDITASKPNPEVFLLAAERIGVESSACAVIEDADAGLTAARAAGMLPIAMPPSRAAISIDSVEELQRMFPGK